MKSGLFLMSGLALMSAFMACSNDDELQAVVQAEGTPLVVQSVGVAGVDTKAGIRAASFKDGVTLGLFIYTGNLTGSYDVVSGSTVNVPYQKSTVGSAEKWTAANPIVLSSKAGNVFAYYPYVSSSSTPSAIPVTVSTAQGTGLSNGTEDALEQTDYMYSTSVSNVSNKKSAIANLVMNHALAMLSFKFVTGSPAYPGTGTVSSIKIYNVNGAQVVSTGSGTMNISTGVATATSPATGNSITVSPNITAATMNGGDESKVAKMLVYPTGSISTNQAELLVTIDGNNYKVPVPAGTGWAKGTNNTYTLTLKGTGLSITKVSIAQWQTGQAVSADIQTPEV